MLRRPERNSALSLTRATRIAGDDRADDEAVFADAVDFVMDRAVSRRFKSASPRQTVGLEVDDSPIRRSLSSVKRAMRARCRTLKAAFGGWRRARGRNHPCRARDRATSAGDEPRSVPTVGIDDDAMGNISPGSIVASGRTPEVVAATARGRMVMTFV